MSEANDNEMFLTVRQTAQLLQLTENTVYELLSSGDLPGRNFGGSWRIPQSKLLSDEQSRDAIKP